MEPTGTPPRLTLHKAEKLRHRTLVEGLFAEGESLYDWPLRVNYRLMTADELRGSFRGPAPDGINALQMMVTVPKKRIRHAVDRVLIRRRIREAYRLNRPALREAVVANGDVRTLAMAFIYIADKETDYAVIEKKMKRLLTRLEARVTQSYPENASPEEPSREL